MVRLCWFKAAFMLPACVTLLRVFSACILLKCLPSIHVWNSAKAKRPCHKDKYSFSYCVPAEHIPPLPRLCRGKFCEIIFLFGCWYPGLQLYCLHTCREEVFVKVRTPHAIAFRVLFSKCGILCCRGAALLIVVCHQFNK